MCGAAVLHGAAVRPHHQACHAGAEGQVKRVARGRRGGGGRPNVLTFSFPIPQKGGGEASSAPLCPSPTPGPGYGTVKRTSKTENVQIFLLLAAAMLGPDFTLFTLSMFSDCGTPASSSASL